MWLVIRVGLLSKDACHMALSHPHWTEMHEAYSIRSSLASNRGTIRLSQPPARTKMPRFMLKAGLDTPLQAGIIWSGSGPRGGERVFWGWGVELGGRGRGGGGAAHGNMSPSPGMPPAALSSPSNMPPPTSKATRRLLLQAETISLQTGQLFHSRFLCWGPKIT